MQECDVGSEFVGSRLDVVTKVADDVNGCIPRVEQEAAQDGANRMRAELERGDHAKVPTSAAEGPKEILVFRGTGGQYFVFGNDYLARQQVVYRHAVLANQPTDATSQGQTTNA